MNYTSEMEKAMQQSHHMGYEEYARKLDKRIDVEKKRQREYDRSKYIVAEIDSKLL